MTRVHSVGTITLGSLLMGFGSILLFRPLFPGLSYYDIFRLWPLILIVLGIEILVSNIHHGDIGLKYDKGALALILLFVTFTMGMGIAELCMNYGSMHVVIK